MLQAVIRPHARAGRQRIFETGACGGRRIKAKGCYRDAVRSTKKHVIHGFGLKWVSMMLLVSVPWNRRVWAFPSHHAVLAGRQARPAAAQDRRRLGVTEDEAGAPLAARTPAHPGSRWGLCSRLVGAGVCQKPGPHGLALAWDPALCHRRHPSGRQPVANPPRASANGACRVGGTLGHSSGRRWTSTGMAASRNLWVFSRTALWYAPRLPPGPPLLLVADPEGERHMEAFSARTRRRRPQHPAVGGHALVGRTDV